MARFVFKLEGVLRQRKHLEQQRQRELTDLQTQMAALDAELRSVDASVRSTEQDMRDNRLIGRLDLSFLAAHRRYAFSMQRKALAIAEKMGALQVLMDAARRRLIDAAKDRKSVEKLRQRQLDRWKDDLARSEMHAMDEAGMQLAYQQITEDQAATQ